MIPARHTTALTLAAIAVLWEIAGDLDLVASGAGIRGSYGAPRTYGVEFSASF